MTAQKISAWMGVVLAVIGGPLKILRVLRQSEPLPFVAYDFIALALLLAGSVLVLRHRSGRLMAAGWGFGCAMFYGSFFSHYKIWTAGTGNVAFEHTMVVSTGVFLALNALGLALTLTKPSVATS